MERGPSNINRPHVQFSDPSTSQECRFTYTQYSRWNDQDTTDAYGVQKRTGWGGVAPQAGTRDGGGDEMVVSVVLAMMRAGAWLGDSWQWHCFEAVDPCND